MTASIYLVYQSRPQTGGVPSVDGVWSALVNSDSQANAILNAVAAANQQKNVSVTSQGSNYTAAMELVYTSDPADSFDANYFDTAVAVGSPPGSGAMSANGDAYINVERAAPVFVAGSSYSPVS